MSQTNVDFSGNPVGAELLDDYLTPMQNNILTTNSGSQAPEYAQDGTIWLDNTNASDLKLKMHYNDSDKTIVDVDSGTGVITVDRAANDGNGNNIVNTYARKDEIATVYRVKGSKANYASLPTSGNEVGDVWNVLDTGANYVWTGTEWDKLSETVDLSPYRTSASQDTIDAGKLDKVSTANKVYGTDASGNQTTYDKDSFGQVDDVQVNGTSVVSNKVASVTVPTQTSDLTNNSGFITSSYHDSTKQDTLVSGTNIKTINGSSVLGSGDLEIGAGGSGLEIGDIGIAPLGIDETKNLRRYLNGQVISQTQFATFTDKVKAAVALYPSLSATEANWQAEVTNSKLGQCGKFVIDDTAGTIRLPKVVNINGLQNLANLGGIKAESLPNITGILSETRDNLKITSKAPDNSALYWTGSGSTGNQGMSGTTNTGLAINASRSSSAYQDNAPVQQEAVQYPYFIQVATGSEESVDVSTEIQLNNPYTLFDSKYTEAPLYNASWLKSDGSYYSSSVYVTAYEALLVEANESIVVGETTTLPSGSSYTKRGLSVVNSDDTYTDYDFVVNSSAQTFRLPLLDGSEDLISYRYDTLTFVNNNTYTAPSNGWYGLTNDSASSCVKLSSPSLGESYGNSGSSTSGISSSAFLKVKKGQIITARSNTPSGSTNVLRFYHATGNGSLYYYIGETIQDANVINAAGVLTRVADLSDSYISGLGMPSDKYIDLTLGASGTTYTAPANGWYVFEKATNGDQWFVLYNLNNKMQSRSSINGILGSFIPALKGEKIKIEYNATGATNTFRFIYAEGEN